MLYKELFAEFTNSNNLVSTLVSYDKSKNKLLIIKFLKYLVWNIIIILKKKNIKDRFKLPYSFKLTNKEIDKRKSYLQLREEYMFSQIDERTLLILKSIVTYFNTDAINLIPITGKLLSIINKFEIYFILYN